MRLLADPDTGAAFAAGTDSMTRCEDDAVRVALGGFPLALAAPTDRAHGRWIDDDVRLTLKRDVQELSTVRQAHTLPLIEARGRLVPPPTPDS
ncbi:hypothetical protein GCM10007967_14720 [Xylanimonas ulmi]